MDNNVKIVSIGEGTSEVASTINIASTSEVASTSKIVRPLNEVNYL